MELIVFAVTAVIAIIGAVAMVASKNAVHSALFLLLNFGAIAVLYLLLRAPFLFATQLIIYAGAIIVLFLFVVMLLGAERHEDNRDRLAWQRPVALVMAGLLLAEVAYVVVALPAQAPVTTDEGFGAPEVIAEQLFTTFLLPFQVTAFIILAAIVGVVVLHMQEKRQV
ncbi:MAG TPA: NADH-quinone oxidoreductase subunit J [Roseiflexaceae bacterium]|nr:NADH-quinone oxidoreductase subunit J [Roseiflexaceae bacterium]HMP39916.1 NADH-quinone oxidoreductase subunit J [Roseiflexaceae bacterium]